MSVVLLLFAPPFSGSAASDTSLIPPNTSFTLNAEEARFINSLAPLRIMVDDNFRPLSLYDRKSGTYCGISVDLFRHIAARLGLKYEFLHDKKLSWADKENLLNSGKLDMIMPVSFTAKRAESGMFTDSFYQTYYGAIAKASRQINLHTSYDLAGYKVGVTKASAILSFLQTFMPESRIVTYDNQQAMYQGVKNGRVDIALQNKNVFREDRFDLGFVDLAMFHTIMESPRKYSYYFSKTSDHAQLIRIINRYLGNTDLSRLTSHYDLGEDELILRYSNQKNQRKLLQLGIACLVVLLLVLGVAFLRHRRLTARLSESLREIRSQQQRLQHSENLYKESQRAARIGSYKINFTGSTWESSEALDEILGVKGGTGKTISDWLDLIHTDDRQRVDNYLMEEVLSKHTPFHLEYRIIRKSDGAIRWVYCRGEAIADATGHITELIGTIQDITDRKEAHAKLTHIMREQQIIFDCAPVGIYLLIDRKQVWLNRRIEEIFQYSREELVGQSTRLLYPSQEAYEQLGHEAYPVLEQGREFQTVQELVRRDGTRIWVKYNGRAVDPPDMSKGSIWIVEDITDKIRTEAEKVDLEQKFNQIQKMDSIGRLAGGIAHDFNNILTIILGYNQLAMECIDSSSPLYSNLEEVNRAAERSAELTRQLLAFARKQTITPRNLNINETVSGMLKMLQRLIGEGVRLEWHPAPDIWNVKLDPSQVDQLLTNLCVNARDAIANVGSIRIETRNCCLDDLYCMQHEGCVPGEYVELTVSDNGCGMDKETQLKIFEPFFTTKNPGEGTGLGLATVYGIVKQNSGYIAVSSEVGTGTSFTIYVPRHHGDDAAQPTTDLSMQPTWGNETIMIVEDESLILKITAQALRKQGYSVLTADSPLSALRLAQEHHGEIHLVMTDVIMPEMNGKDLSHAIAAIHPNTKLLFMSGYTADSISHHGVLEEGVHFIQKPFTIPDMSYKVREVLNMPPAADNFRGSAS